MGTGEPIPPPCPAGSSIEVAMTGQTQSEERLTAKGSVQAGPHAQALASLRRMDRALARREWPDRRVLARARKHARERALEVLQADPGQDVAATALPVTAA